MRLLSSSMTTRATAFLRILVASAVLLGAFAQVACSSISGGSGSGAGGQGGLLPPNLASGGSSGGLGGAAVTGGSGAGGVSAPGGMAGGSGGVSTGAGGTADDASSFPNVGVCGQRGKATADAASFDGYEERYIIGEQGFGSYICVVHFDLKRIGDAPPGCTECTWTHLLEYGNPSVTTDTDGVCALSDLGLDTAAIAKIVGTRVAIGFAAHLGGAHGSARMRYFDDKQLWDVTGNANWSETTKAFSYDYREGYCNYGP